MQIDLRTQSASRPVRITLDPDSEILGGQRSTPPPVAALHSAPSLNWDGALDAAGHLRCCPVCGCSELFARRDFPQKTGLLIVVLGAVSAATAFVAGYVLWGFAALGAVALIDLLIFPFTKRCLVCYRCRSEFRRLPIRRNHPAWDLATGEKYRHRVT